MYNLFNSSNLNFIVSALGMIELTYIDVSKNIHNYVANFIDSNNIPHFLLHEILDISHAQDLFSLIINIDDPNVVNGIMKGYEILNEFFEILFIDILSK